MARGVFLPPLKGQSCSTSGLPNTGTVLPPSSNGSDLLDAKYSDCSIPPCITAPAPAHQNSQVVSRQPGQSFPAPHGTKDTKPRLQKPQSPFLVFLKSERCKVKREFKDASADFIETEVKNRWINIDSSKKCELEKKYKQQMEDYELKSKLYEVKKAHMKKIKPSKKAVPKGRFILFSS